MQSAAASPESPTCRSDRTDRQAVVRHVHDGDTLILANGEKLRVIGLDTPELARNGKPSQAYAHSARRYAASLIAASDNRVQLRYDQESHDRHNRRLAHVFLANGQNLTAQLLQAGLATLLNVPPNLAYSDCYLQQEALARRDKRGIWRLPQYQVISIQRLHASSEGFHRLQATVQKVTRGPHHIILWLENQVQLRIDRKHWSYFSGWNFTPMQGRRVTVRGWLHPHRQHYRMRIDHPSAFEDIE